MDTLYTLCRSVDNRCVPPLTAEQVKEIAAHKQAYFEQEAAQNPLVQAILGRGTVTYFGIEQDDRHGLLVGPAGFFRTHEILRQSRRTNAPLKIDGREYPHNEVAALFARCIPNAKLQHNPWFSPARYLTSLGLVWGLTAIAAHLAARDDGEGLLFDPAILYFLGLGGTGAALVTSALARNRDVRQGSPWNSATYLDLNADLVRRRSDLLALARKEHIPQQRPFKTPEFYYPLVRRIEAHGFDEELGRLR
jgi:hypothetical protein